MKSLMQLFPKFLAAASKEHPLVIMFDSLDQLHLSEGARRLAWLPRKLPDHVKMLLSFLPDSKYKYFPKLQVLRSILA